MTWHKGSASRAAWATAASAAMDRAAQADRLQASLEADGWTVTRRVCANEVAVELERPSGIPGLVDFVRYAGPTAWDALRFAVSDMLNDKAEGR